MRNWGIGLVTIGLIFWLIGGVMDTTVANGGSGRSYNIGLLNQQLSSIVVGASVFASGVICLVGFAIAQGMTKLQVSPPSAQSINSSTTFPASAASRPLNVHVGQKIRHSMYGTGEIVELEDGGRAANVRFDGNGKTHNLPTTSLQPA
jgi:hypothetical protein